MITSRADGRVEEIRARYLVGADGAHSTVRGMLGIPCDSLGSEGDHLATLFRADLSAVVSGMPHASDRDRGPGRRGDVRADRGSRPLDLRHRVASRGRRDAGRLAGRADGGADPSGGRRAGPQPRRDRDVPLGLRSGRRAAAAVRPGLPGRRCRAPHDATRCDRDEHRHRRRAQPGLETCLGRSRLGRRGAAGQLRGRTRRGRAGQRPGLHADRVWAPRPTSALAQDFGVVYQSAAMLGPGPLVGHRAPHAWITVDGRSASSLDLFDGRLTVLTGPAGCAVAGAGRGTGSGRDSGRRAGPRPGTG